jgi:hypothetical protein
MSVASACLKTRYNPSYSDTCYHSTRHLKLSVMSCPRLAKLAQCDLSEYVLLGLGTQFRKSRNDLREIQGWVTLSKLIIDLIAALRRPFNRPR